VVGRVPRIGANDDINKKILYDQHFPAALSEFTEAYKRLSPHPEHFDEFLATLSNSAAALQGWTDEQLAGITRPHLDRGRRPRLHDRRTCSFASVGESEAHACFGDPSAVRMSGTCR